MSINNNEIKVSAYYSLASHPNVFSPNTPQLHLHGSRKPIMDVFLSIPHVHSMIIYVQLLLKQNVGHL